VGGGGRVVRGILLLLLWLIELSKITRSLPLLPLQVAMEAI
jgi:hypothetical protein